MTPLRTTAAVPWTSSLKQGIRRPVAVQEPKGDVLLEVLELDEAARPDLADPVDECLDERVVRGAPEARRPIAQVERVLEERVVVRPDVERDGQGQDRMDAAGGRVQGQLSDRDRHPAGALVAEAQDPLVVGHDDQPDVLVRRGPRGPPGCGPGPPASARSRVFAGRCG